jgi:CspA family cold shock protein
MRKFIFLNFLNYRRIDIMANGTVKWFNTSKGYGFIEPDSGDKDVFIHISAVEKSGLKTLLENQKVSYETNQDKGRTSAANIKVIG